MIINHPQPGDIVGLRLLWQEAFGDSDSFLDGFFRTGFHPERCRLILEKGEPAAPWNIHPLVLVLILLPSSYSPLRVF